MDPQGSRSLIDFIDTPILVGDPEGRAVYVNPAFERFFHTSRASVTGVAMANLFQGGGREAVLHAVVQVCAGEPTTRFRLRENEQGWLALASPVEVDEGRVGVIILLTEEPGGEDRLQSFRREMLEPLDELAGFLAGLCQVVDGRPEPEHRMAIQDGLRTIERLRKWAASLENELRGGRR